MHLYTRKFKVLSILHLKSGMCDSQQYPLNLNCVKNKPISYKQKNQIRYRCSQLHHLVVSQKAIEEKNRIMSRLMQLLLNNNQLSTNKIQFLLANNLKSLNTASLRYIYVFFFQLFYKLPYFFLISEKCTICKDW